MDERVGRLATYYLTQASEGKIEYLASLWGLLREYSKHVNHNLYFELLEDSDGVAYAISELERLSQLRSKDPTYARRYYSARNTYLRYLIAAAEYLLRLGLVEDISDIIEKLESQDSEEYEREEYSEI